MKSLLRTLVALALVSFCATANADSIRLKDGTHVKGHATAYDEALKVLSWEDEAGKDREFKLEELDQRSSYRVLKSQVPKDSGKGQLQLANFTRDIEFFAHAVRHYGYAEAADPSLKPEIDKQIEVLKARAAKWGMQRAQECADKKDIKGAEKWLTKIITKLPDSPEAAEAKTILDNYYARVHAERTAEVDAKAQEAFEKGLAKGKKAYQDMLDKNHKALKSPKGGSPAVKGWENAIKDGERAMREIDNFEKKNSGYTEILNEYRDAVNEQMFEIYLHLANHWATRSSYNKALVQVNNILAVDPKNEQALSMRNRIQEASSRGGRWLW
jgi:hypothetical protein